MLTASELAEARALQRTLMLDRVQIHRKQGEEWDEEAGRMVASWPLVADVPARISMPQGSGPIAVSGVLVYPEQTAITVPHDTDLYAGDRVTITTAQYDPTLTGVAPMAIASVERQTFTTARRFHVTSTGTQP